MNSTKPLQPRIRFLLALLSCLLICAFPLMLLFSLVRFLRSLFGWLTGRKTSARRTRMDAGKARQQVRQAKAAYNRAKRRYVRASDELARAQTALETAQKTSQKTLAPKGDAASEEDEALEAEPAVRTSAGFLSPNLTRFLYGLLKALINHLIDRNLKKAI